MKKNVVKAVTTKQPTVAEVEKTETVEAVKTETVERQATETVETTTATTDNNTDNTTDDMVTTDTLNAIEATLEADAKPKKRVRVEKKEKGLVERTDTVLLTEDNKMLLND